MADREVVGIELVAKLDQLRSEFKSLPKTTDDETKKAVSLALKNLTRLEKGAAKSAKAASDSIGDKAGGGIKAFGEKAGDADTALKALAGAVGLVSPAAGAALSSIGDLAGGVEGASKATALMGVAGTAAAVGVVAVAASVAAFGAAAVGAVSASLDLAQGWREIQGLGGLDSFQITSEQQASLEKGEAALTSIKLAGEAVVVAFASQVAPTVEKAAVGFTFLALGAGKVISSFGEAGGVASDLATVLRGYLVSAFDAVAGGVATAIDALAYLYDATGADELAASMRRGAEALRSYSSELDAKATEDQAAALSRLGDAAKATYDETKALVGILRSHNKETRNAKGAEDAAKDAAKAASDLATVQAVLASATTDTSNAYIKLAADEEKAIATLVKHHATEAQITEVREAYAARRVKLTQETVKEVLALEQGASKSLMAVVNGYVTEQLTAQEQLETELSTVRAQIIEGERAAQAELAKIAEEAKAGGDLEALQEIENQRIEIAQQTQDALTSIAEEGAERRKELSKDELVSGIQDTLKLSGEATDAWSTLMSDKYSKTQDEITAAKEAGDHELVASLEARAEKEKQILTKLFNMDKAVKLSQITMDTASGIGAVWARWAHRPVFAGILSGLVTATGIAQGATIAAAQPAFHVGGIVPAYGASQGTGEVSARLLPDEVVLNRQAVQGMGGPQAANSLNHGGGGMGGQITLNQVWRGSTLDRVVYDVSRLPGSKTRQLTQGGRVGKRTR